MSIVIFLVILAVLILVHEFGHFLLAKQAGIRVDEFGLGFPPRLFGRRKGETMYSINAIPFGGFVKIFGEDPSEEARNGPDAARSFINRPRATQAAVLGAGVVFNLLFAWLLLTAAFTSGMPASVGFAEGLPVTNERVIITSVLPGSSAERAGLESGDIIRAVDAKDGVVGAVSVEAIQQFIAARGGEPLLLTYERDGAVEQASVTPAVLAFETLEASGAAARPVIGITMDMIGEVALPLHLAAVASGRLSFELPGRIAVGLGELIAGAIRGTADFSEVAGPVGIVGLVGEAAQFGFVSLLSFTAFISLNLAVINLLPFPALDGGRLLFVGIEALKRSPISPRIANTANTVGFVLLILLMLAVTYNDVVRLLH
ncbi:MAG: site-2 protease family protein [bacterium]|nr:site-2 protease family protein [bacterium]MDZ4284592.1 site-2 protease family protein [Patescibacteria group bacterium]